jgi:hypothetical protein
MKVFKSNRGMTFIEVLVTAAISIVGASLLFFFVQKVRTHKSGVDGSLIVKEAMADNIVEIKGASLADLPEPATCLVRTYQNNKTFVSEQLLNYTCSSVSVERGKFKVMWEVESTTAAAEGITFQPTTLELPTTTDPLRKITVHSWFYRSPAAITVDHNQIVIFKR